MSFVIIGASSGLGRKLAYESAAAGHDLVIVSPDMRDVAAIAADLSIRHSIRVVPVQADLGDEDGYEDIIFDASKKVGKINGLLFPVGLVRGDDNGSLSLAGADQLMRINFLSIVAIVNKFIPILQNEPYSVIVGFGSISAERGRGTNVIYAAAKRALASYFESLRCICASGRINVQYYILGYLKTNLSFGMHTLLPKTDPTQVSKNVIKNIMNRFGVVYYPRYWKYICWLFKLIPWYIFKKMKI